MTCVLHILQDLQPAFSTEAERRVPQFSQLPKKQLDQEIKGLEKNDIFVRISYIMPTDVTRHSAWTFEFPYVPYSSEECLWLHIQVRPVLGTQSH